MKREAENIYHVTSELKNDEMGCRDQRVEKEEQTETERDRERA